MGSFSNYLENALLNHTFKGSVFTQPTNIYVALSTTDPGETGGSITEPALSSGYYRVALNTWSTASTGAIGNTSGIAFPAAIGPWGTIAHCALFDASGLGNMLAYNTLAVAKTVTQGDIMNFASGSIVINLD